MDSCTSLNFIVTSPLVISENSNVNSYLNGIFLVVPLLVEQIVHMAVNMHSPHQVLILHVLLWFAV